MLSNRTKKQLLASLPLIAAVAVVAIPEIAAAGGISEFSTPLEKVGNTITGDVGKWVSIACMAMSGIYYILNREDLTGGMKLLLQVTFGISFIAFAISIVNTMWTFSGAVI